MVNYVVPNFVLQAYHSTKLLAFTMEPLIQNQEKEKLTDPHC